MACNDERTSSLDAGFTRQLQTGPALKLNIEDGSDVFACGEGFTRAEVEADQVEAITGAPRRCQGSEGGFVCQCGGEQKRSYALGCAAALFESCGVEAESVDGSDEPVALPTECEANSRGLKGSCTQGEDGDYTCECDEDGSNVDVPLVSPETPASCEQALFTACARSCEDDFGACAPSESGALGEHQCTCTTNEFTHLVRAESCEASLLWACNPLNQAEEVCSGYGGYCVAIDPDKQTELSCTCADGRTLEVEHVPDAVEPRWRACRETLEATCGTGAPPEGAQCIAESNGYHARCTRGPGSGATLTCECYADGSDDADVEPVADSSCDTATLQAFCPELTD